MDIWQSLGKQQCEWTCNTVHKEWRLCPGWMFTAEETLHEMDEKGVISGNESLPLANPVLTYWARVRSGRRAREQLRTGSTTRASLHHSCSWHLPCVGLELSTTKSKLSPNMDYQLLSSRCITSDWLYPWRGRQFCFGNDITEYLFTIIAFHTFLVKETHFTATYVQQMGLSSCLSESHHGYTLTENRKKEHFPMHLMKPAQ